MARNVYLVGSVPMANAAEVFETVSAALGARIKRLPDGGTRIRSVCPQDAGAARFRENRRASALEG